MKKMLLMSMLVLCSSAVLAQPYVAAGVSHQQMKVEGGLSDSRSALSLGAGYRVGALAAEAGCADSDDCSVAGVAALPLAGGFSAIARAGAYYLRGNLIERRATGSAPFSPTTSIDHAWSGWTAGAGVGFQYVAQNGYGARLLLEQTGRVGQLERVRAASLSLLYSF